VILLAAAAAPFIGADRFATTIERGLEQSLGRPVEIRGKVRFRLLPRPGFTIDDPEGGIAVVIEELPQFGVEPLAYVESLTVAVALPALLTGRVELVGILLENPHVNLTKLDTGGWNVQPLVTRALAPPSGVRRSLPAIEVTGGRINFKLGDRKSVFYLAETDLTVEADTSDPDRLGVRFEGEPARTDRASRGFGRLSGRGLVHLNRRPNEQSRMELSLSLEKSSIGEFMTLVEGRSIGLSGMVASEARLSGPASNIEITGRLKLDVTDRFRAILSRASDRGLDFRGHLDLRQQEFRLETLPRSDTPVSVRVRASDLFGRARWAALLTLREAPLESIGSLAREVGVTMPADLPVSGRTSGALGIAGSVVKGGVTFTEAAFGGATPMEVASAELRVNGRQMEFTPTVVRFGQEEVRVEGRLNAASGRREFSAQTAGISVSRWRQFMQNVLRTPATPLLEHVIDGRWSGVLRSHAEGDGAAVWNGELRLINSRLRVEGLAEPVRLDNAQFRIRGSTLAARRLAGWLGRVQFSGEYASGGRPGRPDQLTLTIPRMGADDIEAIVVPALQRRRGLLDRALQRSGTGPAWLGRRRLDAGVHIGLLDLGEYSIEEVKARLSWDGPRLAVRDLAGTLAQGQLAGKAAINLDASEPMSEGNVALLGLPSLDGRLTLEADWSSRGAGAAFWRNLAARGTFQGHQLDAGSHTLESVSGRFEYSSQAGSTRLQIAEMQATVAGEACHGQGSSQPDGRLVVELAGSGRPIRLAGRLSGLRLEFASVP
jgi:hypothetical protein